jgi:hypothetical protein
MKLKIGTGGRKSDLFKRWFELDEEAEADIAQLPEWLRPFARIASKGFGWVVAVVPIVVLGFGLYLMSGNDIESGSEFDSLSACLSAIQDEFPEHELHLNESQTGVISGVLEASAETFRCETQSDDPDSAVVLLRSPGDVPESSAETMEDEDSGDSAWSIRKSKTTFIRPFGRIGQPAPPDTARARQGTTKKSDAAATIPAATGRCIAGCADFPNGFYDMKE